MDYIDDLMRNHPLTSETEFSADRYLEKMIGETDSEDTLNDGQIGGENSSKPSGGFPPIIICKNADTETEELMTNTSKVKREYETVKSSVKIQDILNKRKEAVPFISLK